MESSVTSKVPMRICGWNIAKGAPTDCPNQAISRLGRGRKAWFLCVACADLPRFSRFNKFNRGILFYRTFDAATGAMVNETYPAGAGAGV